MEHDPALKRNGSWTQATPWVKLEDVSNEQKGKYYMIPLLGNTQSCQIL